MSTLAATNLKNEASASNNIVLNADGTVSLNGAFSGDVNFDSGTLFIDTTNNRVGIGTTSPSNSLHVEGTIEVSSSTNFFTVHNTSEYIGFIGNNSGNLFINAGGTNDVLELQTNGAERARIDSSGRLLVGTDSARQLAVTPFFQIEGTTGATSSAAISRNSNSNASPSLRFAKTRGTANGSFTIVQSDDELGAIYFFGADGVDTDSIGASIAAQVDGTPGTGDMPGRLMFSTTADGAASPTERMRIGNNGLTDLFVSGADGFQSRNSAASGTTVATFVGRHSSTTVKNGTISFRVWTNGDVQNTNNSYGAISDITLKENIIPASSQWSDIKDIEVVNYNFKEETGHQTHKQLGVIAQQVEAVSPGLVDTDADGLKSVNYSVLYMKAVKALQEAMKRIEVLEAKVNALKGN